MMTTVLVGPGVTMTSGLGLGTIFSITVRLFFTITLEDEDVVKARTRRVPASRADTRRSRHAFFAA
jgi:hypothetical protein